MGSNSQGSGWRRIRGVSGHPLARLFGHRNKNHWSILGSKLSNEHPRVPWKHLWNALGSLQGVRGAREGDAARLVHHCAKLASDLHTVTADLLNSCSTIFTDERCHGMSFLLPACRWVRPGVKTHWALNTGSTQRADRLANDARASSRALQS